MAIYSLTGNGRSPFHAEPPQLKVPKTLVQFGFFVIFITFV